MQNYQVKLGGQWFKRPVLQAGWSQADIGETELSITGKALPGIGAALLLGALIAQALAKPKTVAIPYRDVLDVAINGNKITLKFKYETKDQVLILYPFQEKGFWGGKGELGQDFMTRLQEKCGA